MSETEAAMIPERVIVGPYTYPVRRVTELRSDKGEDLWGQITYAKPDTAIRILADIPDDRAWVTLLHESLHALDDLVSLGLTEKQITRLAPALAAYLIANGWGPK